MYSGIIHLNHAALLAANYVVLSWSSVTCLSILDPYQMGFVNSGQTRCAKYVCIGHCLQRANDIRSHFKKRTPRRECKFLIVHSQLFSFYYRMGSVFKSCYSASLSIVAHNSTALDRKTWIKSEGVLSPHIQKPLATFFFNNETENLL